MKIQHKAYGAKVLTDLICDNGLHYEPPCTILQ